MPGRRLRLRRSEVRPYLLMMGKTATYMGPSGCGSTAQVANNLMVGIHLCAMGEAFAFAKKAGLDPQTLFDAIKGGFAQSAVMDGKVPKLLSRDFSASARIAVHLKDINNAMDVAAHLGVELPMTEIVKEQMDWMDARGMIDEDQCALAKYYEDAMGVEIKCSPAKEQAICGDRHQPVPAGFPCGTESSDFLRDSCGKSCKAAQNMVHCSRIHTAGDSSRPFFAV